MKTGGRKSRISRIIGFDRWKLRPASNKVGSPQKSNRSGPVVAGSAQKKSDKSNHWILPVQIAAAHQIKSDRRQKSDRGKQSDHPEALAACAPKKSDKSNHWIYRWELRPNIRESRIAGKIRIAGNNRIAPRLLPHVVPRKSRICRIIGFYRWELRPHIR